jgi:peptidoglycan-associated lipoprotein
LTRTITALTALSIVATLGACKKDPEPMAKKPAEPVLIEEEVALPLPPAPVYTPAEQVVENLQRVRFAFDSSSLDAQSKSILDRTATILKEHPEVRLTVQGHADERGTTDYNMALGMRRADAVVDYLAMQGVDRDRLFMVSYGEEKPLLDENNTMAWSANRRVEFVVTADPDGVVDSSIDNPVLGGAQTEMRGADPRSR